MKKLTLSAITFLLLHAVAFAQIGWKYQTSNLSSNRYGAIYAINKDTVYVIADKGKFLKTLNGGTIWTTQSTGITGSFFDLSFINADTGYAAGQKGTIIRTKDGGTHWDSLTSGTKKDLFSISTKDPANLWAVGDSGVILNSHDFGTTWIKNNALTDKKLNSIRFRNSNIGFIAGNSGTLFGTIDGGTNWNVLTIATTKDLFSLSVTGGCAYMLVGWVGSYFSNASELFKTNDNINWVSANSSINGYGNSTLYFQNDSLGYVIVSGCTTNSQCFINIFKTTNYGQNWPFSLGSSPPSTPALAYSDIAFATNKIGYVLCGDNILKTIDGGIFVSIKELDDKYDLKIYPNPAVKNLTIDNRQFAKGVTHIAIYDACGKQVLQETNNANLITEIDMRDLKAGMYIIKLYTEDGLVSTAKFLKDK
jgi:photosystem II stability/assembly factor-like uncharacterized protein